ncbi:MAG: tRNA lysidine(34) synthetase TilS [Tannerella sp.]|jgi:tRNA(Ile)-lysidine synthase|nr:tRNA lysidine(34) synthetase TilS [Tannerella sp.]
MLCTIRAYIEKNRLIQPDDKIIVGLSGGADSVALLHLLVRLGYSCIAAHCNFHLRGEESDGDEVFAGEVADSLNVPFYRTDFDTAGYAVRQHISVEMAARELRYRWFEELRIAENMQAIAVAHHRDDSVETWLLNAMRGTGIRGLCGIRPRNGYVVRPLLIVSRKNILDWLSQEGLSYRTDTTNLSDEYVRNFIRLHILPLMEQVNPSVKEAITRTASHLADVEKIYDEWLEEEWMKVMNGRLRISIAQLMQSSAPRTLLYETIRPYGFTRIQTEAVFEALQGISGKVFDAQAAPYRIIKDREFLLITEKTGRDDTVCYVDENAQLTAPVALSVYKKKVDEAFSIEKDPSVATFDYDKLSFPLTLRTWREGDWFIPFGTKGRKKLSDYYTDHKFSLIRKNQTWLLCNGTDVIWIVGERSDERYRVSSSTKEVLVVKFFG